MTRLGMFAAFFPATYVLMVNADDQDIANILAWYLGAFVTGYVGGKAADVGMQAVIRRKDAGKGRPLGVE